MGPIPLGHSNKTEFSQRLANAHHKHVLVVRKIPHRTPECTNTTKYDWLSRPIQWDYMKHKHTKYMRNCVLDWTQTNTCIYYEIETRVRLASGSKSSLAFSCGQRRTLKAGTSRLAHIWSSKLTLILSALISKIAALYQVVDFGFFLTSTGGPIISRGTLSAREAKKQTALLKQAGLRLHLDLPRASLSQLLQW